MDHSAIRNREESLAAALCRNLTSVVPDDHTHCWPSPEEPLPGSRRPRGYPFGRSSGPEAAIIGGTVSSVLGNLSEQNKRDVANSLEYATHVAHQKTSEDEGFERFWEEYMNCLFSIGWERTRNEWSNLSLEDTTSDVETFCDYVVDNIRNDPLYTQDEKDLIIRALEVIRSQTDQHEFFRRFTVRKSFGVLGVSTALVKDDVLKLRFSAFMFSCDADVQDYLTTSIAHIRFDAKKGVIAARADQRIIDLYRALIEEELEQASGDYIHRIDI